MGYAALHPSYAGLCFIREGAAALDIHVYRGTFSFGGFFPTSASMHIVECILCLLYNFRSWPS